MFATKCGSVARNRDRKRPQAVPMLNILYKDYVHTKPADSENAAEYHMCPS